MSDLVHSENNPIYHRINGESATEYEMFVEWCRIPSSSRNLGNFCRRTGFGQRIARNAMNKWDWENRAMMFDVDSNNLKPDPSTMDEEIALAGQKAAAITLLDLGLSALSVKNPSLISVDAAIKLVDKGSEIQRRAYGNKSLDAEFTVEDLTRVNDMLEELAKISKNENVVDAEVVDETTDSDTTS